MAPPKLTYFPIRGLGEPIRFVLSYANEKFIDDRITTEDWPKIKPTTPFGKLPILEIDGKIVNQTAAICRYYAKKAGIAGKDDWEALLIDATVGTFDDMRMAISGYHTDPNEESKAKKYDILIKETIPFYMGRLDKQVEENEGFFVNGKLSWADLWVVALLGTMSYFAKIDLVEDYPNVRALKDKVLSIPQIKAWAAKRPLTDY
uniref:glutathione transferase n=1 Tax=Bemisia tabaci TaxID=7038 RepID=A0A223FR00_BEMTA|nr:glutathione S-transferase s1 [Bemisia tabaci]